MSVARLIALADDAIRPRPRSAQRIDGLLLCVVVYAGLYGGAMGLYRLTVGQPEWALQASFSAIKAPLLILGALLVSLPVFFVLCALLGMRRDFLPAVRSILAGQATLAVTLAALAPVTLLQYLAGAGYREALVFNGAVFAVASLVGQTVVSRRFQTLHAAAANRRRLLVAWGFAYALVAVQLAWLLRPFIGSATQSVSFFRSGAWDNAYVTVASLVWQTLVGGSP